MAGQTIISVSREFGSGGHEIAEKIAKDLGMKFYDRKMLDEIAAEMNVQVELLEKYDEKPRNYMLTRTVGKYTNSMEEILAEIQFDFIKEKADKGESFVVVGRCSEAILKDYEGLISIFVSGKKEQKTARVMERYQLSEAEALVKMARHDRKRKRYHNRHADTKWGDPDTMIFVLTAVRCRSMERFGFLRIIFRKESMHRINACILRRIALY